MRESELAERFAAGDSSVFGEVFDRYSGAVYGFAHRMLGNRTDAEDVCAETFVRAFERASDLRSAEAMGTWLFAIARRLCADKGRVRAKMLSRNEFDGGGFAEGSDARVAVQEALRDLSQPHREAIVLCDLEDMPHREAAALLGLSVPCLKSRLYRGRRALRASLSGASLFGEVW